jgi:rod shape determining protein RodA
MVSKPQPKPFDESAPARTPSPLAFDWLLAIAMLGLIGASIAMMATTTVGDVEGSPHYYTIRQATYGAVGVVLMLLLARIDYSRFRELRFGLYAVMLACITAVLLLGATTRGSQRWIELPFFTFQPSELGKVLLIVALAAFVIERSWRASELQRTARLLLVGALPAALVLLQPDLGTAMV